MALFCLKVSSLNYIVFLLIPWIVNFFYFVGLFPQIYLNYKSKSTQGLSDLLILGYFDGYLAYFIYAYFFEFPIAYRMLLPVAVLASLVLIYQRFFYQRDGLGKSNNYIYYINFLLMIFFGIFLYLLPMKAANIAGWISTAIWYLYLIPQVIEIYLRKTVKGFSFLLVLFVGLGGVADFSVAILYSLPIQIILIGLRGIAFFFIFAAQFWIYRKN